MSLRSPLPLAAAHGLVRRAPAGRLRRSSLSCAALALLWGSGALQAQTGAAAPPETSSPEAAQAVTVTGTRERALVTETPASVGVISGRDLRFTGPMHPQQLLGQVPGVAVAVTNGEGHSTAIRQPFTTGPLYLYLEDGIATRATGFFNHNALYEVNLPGAGGVEVIRGPGTALYGSDAIGGIVNVLTRTPSATPELSLSPEVGSFGWRRVLADGNLSWSPDAALRTAVNVTHTDGWRAATGYDRESVNVRWDHALSAGVRTKTILGFTRIDQQTGANSALVLADYLNNPKKNNFSIAYRKVQALRVSTELEIEQGATLWTLTPYLRSNFMELNGSFNLASDPRIEKSDVQSLGLLAKWRHDVGGPLRLRLVAGLDLDRSPGTRVEDALNLTRVGSGANTSYTGYTVGNRIYDYEVVFKSVSSYVHAELSPVPSVRVSAGLRADRLSFDMRNALTTATTQASTRVYGQQAAAQADFSHLSPKLGATWALTPALSAYASLNHGFRAPSEGQLFRAGSAANASDALARAQLALALKPIKADQFELGLRRQGSQWQWEAVAYDLVKRDDLVSQRDLATNVSTNVNAGKTRHRGIEVSLGGRLAPGWRLDAALSKAKHNYEDWVTATANFSGKEMESAPRLIANTRLSWSPRPGATVQAEWVRIGPYWLEASNSATFGQYAGHDVFNLRWRQEVSPHLAWFARLMNLSDKRYADSASVSSNTPVFSPALPRALYAGLEARW